MPRAPATSPRPGIRSRCGRSRPSSTSSARSWRQRSGLVAEAAFQDRLWRHGLEPLLERVELRIVQCDVDLAVSWERARQRVAARPAHAVGDHVHDLDAWTEVFGAFERLSLEAPSLSVDTTDGYAPTLAEVAAFVRG